MKECYNEYYSYGGFIMGLSTTFFQELIYTIPALLIALVFHEWAHGYISYKLGDPLPKQEGRLSLNPLKHLDPMGSLCLLLFHFGWAKPVMVNPRAYKDKKMGMSLVALAGPCMNFICAFIALFILVLIIKINPYFMQNSILVYIFNVLRYTAILCIGLGVFNLIPIPPLDGSKIMFSFLREDLYFKYMQYENYGMILLVVLLALGVLGSILTPLTSALFNGMLNIITMILL